MVNFAELNENQRQLKLLRIKAKACRECPVVQETCDGPTPGYGNKTGIVGVGRNPGRHEDSQSGRPFSGPSGEVLDSLFFPVAGLTRADLFLTNVMLCHTFNDEEPPLEHVKTCVNQHLYNYLDFLDPYLVITFGALASYVLAGTDLITHIHGTLFRNKRGFYVIPCLHPGAVLYQPKRKDQIRSDALAVRKFLAHKDEYKVQMRDWLRVQKGSEGFRRVQKGSEGLKCER